MGYVNLSKEEFIAITDIANKVVTAFKKIWAMLSDFAKKIACILRMPPRLIETLIKKESKKHMKQKFNSLAYTKGRIFKSQVQDNKPKFIKARTHL